MLLGVLRGVLRRPRLKRAARAVLQHMPRLRARLQGWMHRAVLSPDAMARARPRPSGEMTPRSARMYRELQQALEARKD